MPENPSEPPHFSPTHNRESGAGARLQLSLISISWTKVLRIASDIIASSDPLCCCSNTRRGFENFASRFLICSRSIATCEC